MNRVLRAVLAGIAGLLFFGWLGPMGADRLRQDRAEEARAFSTTEIRAAYLEAGSAPSPEVGVELDLIDAAAAREEAWNTRVAAILTPAQRDRARSLGLAVPTTAPTGDERVVEPEVQALARELLDEVGVGEVILPATPIRDPWPGVDRRSRARALQGLLRAGELPDEQARAVLQVTLDALDAQVERTVAERALREALPTEVLAAALEARRASRDPLLGGAP